MNIEKAWQRFFGSGWGVKETPCKRECFEAGWRACLEHMKDKVKLKEGDE